MSREKADSDNRRIIIDLSWPKGVSINNFTPPNVYLNTVYKLQYPTIDNITEALASLGQGAYLYKIDLSRAFRQLRIDPIDYSLLCLKWGTPIIRMFFVLLATEPEVWLVDSFLITLDM